MPPRARKVDPAVLAQQFEAWKSSEEYSHWYELFRLRQEIPKNITVTTRDMTTTVESFLSRLHVFTGLMKVSRKSHSYEQFALRTAFFPQVGHDLIFKVDGHTFELQKDSVDIARDTRQAFCEILNHLKTIEDADETNFQNIKKDFTKKLSTFEKTYTSHLKKAHDYLSKDILMVIIRPLYDAVEANMNLYYLENRAHEKKKWFKDQAALFRIKACREKFAETVTVLIKALNDHGPLKFIPDINKSLQKLEIDTAHHPVLKFFVNPVKNAWRKFRSEMKVLGKGGINKFKQPLVKNKAIVACLDTLILADNLAEALLGDELKKDQLIFIYDVLKHIYHSPLKEHLKKNDPLIINIVAAELAAFKALQQMYKVNEDIANKKGDLTEAGVPLPEEDNFEGLERQWVWEGYIRESEMSLWVECSQLVSNLNLMVQEDLIDWLISRHVDKKNVPLGEKERRPPYIWNEQIMENRYVLLEDPIFKEDEEPKKEQQEDEEEEEKEEEEPHVFRIHAEPEVNYRDGRVQEVVDKLEIIARGLKGHIREMWERLITKTILAFTQDMPESDEEDISFEEELEQEEEKKEENVEEVKE